MKRGFTLIEVILGVMIASILALTLIRSFYHIRQSVVRVDGLTVVGSRMATLHGLLERDLAGAFIPGAFQPKKSDEKPVGDKSAVADEKPKRVFYGTSHSVDGDAQQQFELLTFITCNPVQVYGEAKPRIARVVYRLVKENEDGSSFKLERQESTKYLEFDKFQNDGEDAVRRYEVVNKIKNFSVDYFVKHDDEKEKITDESSADVTKYQKKASWNSDENSVVDEKEKKKKQLLPDFVEIKASLFESIGRKSSDFEIVIPIISDRPADESTNPKPGQHGPGRIGKTPGHASSLPTGPRSMDQRPMGQREMGQRPAGPRPTGLQGGRSGK